MITYGNRLLFLVKIFTTKTKSIYEQRSTTSFVISYRLGLLVVKYKLYFRLCKRDFWATEITSLSVDILYLFLRTISLQGLNAYVRFSNENGNVTATVLLRKKSIDFIGRLKYSITSSTCNSNCY